MLDIAQLRLYTDSNGNLMSLESQYPSAVVFNITRIPGIQIAACDAVIEVYGVQIVANTGEAENHGYFIGTNYNSSFSGSELSALEVPVTNLADPNVYNEVRGNFCFNWTENTSIFSHSVGSVGCYETDQLVQAYGVLENRTLFQLLFTESAT